MENKKKKKREGSERTDPWDSFGYEARVFIPNLDTYVLGTCAMHKHAIHRRLSKVLRAKSKEERDAFYPNIQEIPLEIIRRPLGRTRTNDANKVEYLMKSIAEIGLQEPIDVLQVDGKYYGFSGCHRFEAHQKLGMKTIRCNVRKATRKTLEMHLR